MQPNQQNPYDFITNAPQTKRAPLFGGGNSKKTRILQVGIIGLFLVILGIVVMTILSNVGKAGTETVYKLAASQQDIIDITTALRTNVRDGALATQAATTSVVITSQNQETTAYLIKQDGKKIDKKIESYRVTTYKKTLDDAQKNGNFDTVYTALLANRLDEYRGKLQAAYNSTSDANMKKKFSDYYQQLNILGPAANTN